MSENTIGKKVPMPLTSVAQIQSALGVDFTIEKIGAGLKTLVRNNEMSIEYVSEDFDDFKQARCVLKIFYTEQGPWSKFTTGQKIVFAKYFVCTTFEALTVLTGDELTMYGYFFHQESIRSREKRIKMIVTYVLANIGPKHAAQNVVKTMEAQQLITNYISIGNEGTLEDNGLEGLYDWVESRAGTSYESSGFIHQQGINAQWGTLADHVPNIMNILKYGTFASA